MRPHRWPPTRLLCPWDSPGKNTGVGCHFLLHCMKVKSQSEVSQSCPTPSDPMDCSLPGSSAHGIFQTRVLEWGAIAFSVPLTYCGSNDQFPDDPWSFSILYVQWLFGYLLLWMTIHVFSHFWSSLCYIKNSLYFRDPSLLWILHILTKILTSLNPEIFSACNFHVIHIHWGLVCVCVCVCVCACTVC